MPVRTLVHSFQKKFSPCAQNKSTTQIQADLPTQKWHTEHTLSYRNSFFKTELYNFGPTVQKYMRIQADLCGTWDRSRRPEGGEWEPIKISSKFESSAYIPKITHALKRSDQSLE